MGRARNPDSEAMDFPTLIALALEESERSDAQAELAERLGIQQGTVSKWVTGSRTPRRQTWPAIASAIGRTVDEVAGAIARTELTEREPLAEQLGQCREELRAARLEISRLQSRLLSTRRGS